MLYHVTRNKNGSNVYAPLRALSLFILFSHPSPAVHRVIMFVVPLSMFHFVLCFHVYLFFICFMCFPSVISFVICHTFSSCLYIPICAFRRFLAMYSQSTCRVVILPLFTFLSLRWSFTFRFRMFVLSYLIFVLDINVFCFVLFCLKAILALCVERLCCFDVPSILLSIKHCTYQRCVTCS